MGNNIREIIDVITNGSETTLKSIVNSDKSENRTHKLPEMRGNRYHFLSTFSSWGVVKV